MVALNFKILQHMFLKRVDEWYHRFFTCGGQKLGQMKTVPNFVVVAKYMNIFQIKVFLSKMINVLHLNNIQTIEMLMSLPWRQIS